MGYRDELGAAVSRADSLAQEIGELKGKADGDAARIAALEAQLHSARQEIEFLKSLHAGSDQPVRRTYPSDRPLARWGGIAAAVIVFCAIAAWLSYEPEPPDWPAPGYTQAEIVVPVPEVPAMPVPAGPLKLQVTSTPAGAEIELDGRIVGVTPLVIEIPSGDHFFVARLRDRVQMRQLGLESDTRLELDFTRLSPSEIELGLGDLRGKVEACTGTQANTQGFVITIERTGRVSTAKIDEAAAGPVEARCLKKIVRALRFPAAPQGTVYAVSL
jgi:hypothetical protein